MEEPGGSTTMNADWISQRAGVRIERKLVPAGAGLVGLAQTFRGDGMRVVVTHRAALVAQVTVREGELSFPRAGADVPAPAEFVLVIPPRTIVRMCFRGARVDSLGVAGDSQLSGPPSLRTFIRFALERDAATRAAAGARLADLDPDRGVPRFVVAARAAMHLHLGHPAPVRRTAGAVGVAPETLTRGFQRAYGIGAKEYCHRARLFEAVLSLLGGAAIAQSAFEAGFNDLKRFYAQFRRAIGATPGAYSIKKRQDGGRPRAP
jgi:AraC-like DNA-binding protein